MLPTSIDFLTSQLRQGDKSFPRDIASLIYEYLPTYRFVDYVIDHMLSPVSESLDWLSKDKLASLPEKLFVYIYNFLGKDFDTVLFNYFCIRNIEEKFIEGLNNICPLFKIFYVYDNQVEFTITYRDFFLLEKYGSLERGYKLTDFRDDYCCDVTPENYYLDVHYGGYHRYDVFYHGSKTIPEAIDFLMKK